MNGGEGVPWRLGFLVFVLPSWILGLILLPFVPNFATLVMFLLPPAVLLLTVLVNEIGWRVFGDSWGGPA